MVVMDIWAIRPGPEGTIMRAQAIMVFILCLMVTVLGALPVSAQQDIAYPCDAFSGSDPRPGSLSFPLTPMTLEAGERYSLIFSYVSGSDPTAFVRLAGPGSVDVSGIPGTVSFTAQEPGVYTLHLTVNSPSSLLWNLDIRCDFPSSAAAGGPCANVYDGRINNSPRLDCAAPVAVYLASVNVYGIDPETGRGVLALSVDESEYAGTPPSSNQLLGRGTNSATGQPISIYWLTTNEILVMTAYADGKPYIIVWPVDNPAGLYHLAV
jgi:hypothetical protein